MLAIRDWRLYGLVLILSPVVSGLHDANVTLLLALGLACLWRVRDRPALAGALVAVMISLKPFMWPLALWLIATRRYRAAGAGLACGLLVNLGSWAVVGLDQIHRYGRLVSSVDAVMDRRGYSVTALVMQAGGGRVVAYLAAGVLVAAACVLLTVLARRGDTTGSFTLAIAVALLATPVVWDHYFALLIVPLALYRPWLDGLWLTTLLLWFCPGLQYPKLWQIWLALGVSVAVIVRLLRTRSTGRPLRLDAPSPVGPALSTAR